MNVLFQFLKRNYRNPNSKNMIPSNTMNIWMCVRRSFWFIFCPTKLLISIPLNFYSNVKFNNFLWIIFNNEWFFYWVGFCVGCSVDSEFAQIKCSSKLCSVGVYTTKPNFCWPEYKCTSDTIDRQSWYLNWNRHVTQLYPQYMKNVQMHTINSTWNFIL